MLSYLESFCSEYGFFSIRKAYLTEWEKKTEYKNSEYFSQTQVSYSASHSGNKGRTGEFFIYQALVPLEGQKRYLFNLYLPKPDGGRTNEGHIKWLRAAIGDPSIPIDSYIVFGNRCVLKKITQSTNLHHVLNRSEVLFHVQENAFEKGVRLLPEQIDALYEKLLPFAQISPELKEMHNEDVRKKQAGDLCHFGK